MNDLALPSVVNDAAAVDPEVLYRLKQLSAGAAMLQQKAVHVEACVFDPERNIVLFGTFDDQSSGEPPLAIRDDRYQPLRGARVFRYEHPNAGAKLCFFIFIPKEAGVETLQAIHLEYARFVIVVGVHPKECDPAALRTPLLSIYDACIRHAKRRGGEFEQIDETFAVPLGTVQQRLAERSHAAKEIQWGQPPEHPAVSVIVPVYERYELIAQQIADFRRDPFLAAQDIIFVLDSVTPRDYRTSVEDLVIVLSSLLRLYPMPMRLIVMNRDSGFAAASNAGARAARAPYLLMLNSDVFPGEPGWLQSMLSCFDADPRVGLVGARLLLPGGAIQHAGLTWRPCPVMPHVFENYSPGKGLAPALAGAVSGVSECHAVTAACMLMRTEEFTALGRFDPGYIIGDFEDSDLSLRFRHVGKRVLCDNRVTLYHCENVSYPSELRTSVQRYNILRHQRRWGETIRGILQAEKPHRG